MSASAVVLADLAPEAIVDQARRLFATFRDRSQQVLDCAHLADLLRSYHDDGNTDELTAADAEAALTHLMSAFFMVSRDLTIGSLTPASFGGETWTEVIPEQMSILAERYVHDLDNEPRALVARVANTSVMRAVRSAAISAAYAPPSDPSTRINGYMRVALAQWRSEGPAASMMAALGVSRITGVRLRGESPRGFANAVRERLDTLPIPPEARAAIEDIIGPTINTGADLEIRFMGDYGRRYWAAL